MDLNQYFKDLETLVNIDSGTLDGHAGIDRIADFFAERFAQMGWQTKKCDLSPNAGPCLICTNREAESYDLFMIGHIDTVFTEGAAAERPFSMDEKYAYGPGVGDMKDGSLLMYYLLKDLPPQINEKLNIVAVFNPDEEMGSPYSRYAYEEYARKSRYAFVYEGKAGNGSSCVERKGGLVYTVRFKGVAGHCGAMFTNGSRSAVHEMGKWIVALSEMMDREKGTSVNVGSAHGGFKKNVVAPDATIEVDIRFECNDEPARFDAAIERLTKQAEENGIGISVERRMKPALVCTERVAEYVEHVLAITKENNIPFFLKKRGGLSDANIIATYGTICLDGLGPLGGASHSEREFMHKDSVLPCYDLSMLLFRDLAENK